MIFSTLAELNETVGHGSGVVLDVVDPPVPLIGFEPTNGINVSNIWRTQPNVRMVVEFIANNIASIPLYVYKRNADNGRERVRDGELARVLGNPGNRLTPFRFWYRVLVDYLLYDYWIVLVQRTETGEYNLVRVPPYRGTIITDGLQRAQTIRVSVNDGTTVDLDPKTVLFDMGYSQTSRGYTSPIVTLSQIISQSQQSLAYRDEVMRNAATHTGIVQRETEWPSQEARNNFVRSLRQFSSGNNRAGGTMLLDEGMKWVDRNYQVPLVDDLEARKLSAVEVCAAYHIQPELLGIREGTYANQEAFRQSLYRDNLGPYITALEQSVNPLVAMLEQPSDNYIKAHVDVKLRGSFQEQASLLVSSTGRPFLTTNEARAKVELNSIEGGDELVTPLNVLVGGQASPHDSGSQNEKQAPVAETKAADEPENETSDKHQLAANTLIGDWEDKAAELFSSFYARQGRSVQAKLGSKSEQWWEQDRWVKELADDLFKLSKLAVADMGPKAAKALGFDPDKEWSLEKCIGYLSAVSKSRARMVNDATYRAIKEALDNAGDTATLFSETETDKRAKRSAAMLLGALSSFTANEAIQQARPGKGGKKTWYTPSPNPRASHRRMNGQSVGTGKLFSNGMQWPHDPAGGADEVAGCTCYVVVESN